MTTNDFSTKLLSITFFDKINWPKFEGMDRCLGSIEQKMEAKKVINILSLFFFYFCNKEITIKLHVISYLKNLNITESLV